MAKPYIQVELDALNKVPLVARATGANPDSVLAGLVALWAHCYREKVNVVRIPELRGFFGVSNGIVDALVSHGFVEDLGDRLRVKGVDRYTRLTEVRAEAGRKGGEATQRKASPKRGDGGRFKGVTEAPPKQLLPSDEQSNRGSTEAKSSSKPASDAGPTVDDGSKTEAIASVDRSKTEATRKHLLEQNPVSPKQNQALYPRSESLSPLRERETLRDESPEQRTSNATPLGAGRDSRTEAPEAATATRVDIPVVPVSPRPAPPEPYRPPVFERRSHLWAPAEMASVSPPDEQWVEAVVWRMQRLTKQTLAWTMDDVYREQVKAVAIYRAVVQEIEPVMGEFVRLIMLSDMDDLITMGDASGPPQLVQWVQDHAKRLNVPMPEPEPDEVIHVH